MEGRREGVCPLPQHNSIRSFTFNCCALGNQSFEDQGRRGATGLCYVVQAVCVPLTSSSARVTVQGSAGKHREEHHPQACRAAGNERGASETDSLTTIGTQCKSRSVVFLGELVICPSRLPVPIPV